MKMQLSVMGVINLKLGENYFQRIPIAGVYLILPPLAIILDANHFNPVNVIQMFCYL